MINTVDLILNNDLLHHKVLVITASTLSTSDALRHLSSHLRSLIESHQDQAEILRARIHRLQRQLAALEAT